MRYILILTVAVLFILAGLDCTTPVRPPDQKPEITEQARHIAEGTIFALKTLRTITDIREIAEPVALGSAILDTPRLESCSWTPAGLTYLAGIGLTKKRAAFGAGKLAASLGSGDTVIIAPDSIIDSAVALADSTFATVYRVAAGVLDSGWQTGIDSLIWRQGSQTTDSLRLFRVMTQTRGDTLVTDHRGWTRTDTVWSLMARHQTWSSVGTPGRAPWFEHGVAMSADIRYDTITTRTDSGLVAEYLARRDKSPAWWSSLQNSTLLAEHDSTVAGDTTTLAVMSSADSDSVVVSFADTSGTQIVRIHETVSTNGGHSVVSADLTAGIGKSMSSITIQSFSQSVKRPLIDSVAYVVDFNQGDPAARTAVLYTTVKPLSVSAKDSTAFGLRVSSSYQFTISYAAGWDRFVYTNLQRTDALAPVANAPLMVEYSAARNDTFPALSALTVRATYPSSNSITRFRVWSRTFTGTIDTLVYTWIGTSGDSARCRTIGDSAHSRYSFDLPSSPARSGTFDVPGTIADTLRVNDGAASFGAARRMVSGTFGDGGTLHVSGLDTFDILQKSDTAFAVAPARLPWTFTWHRSAQAWSAVIPDSLSGLTFTYALAVDVSGIVTGSFTGVDSHSIEAVSCAGLAVSVEGGGTLWINGIITGANDVPAWLKLNLWGENDLNDQYWMY